MKNTTLSTFLYLSIVEQIFKLWFPYHMKFIPKVGIS